MMSLHRRMQRTLGIVNSCLGPLAGKICRRLLASCLPHRTHMCKCQMQMLSESWHRSHQCGRAIHLVLSYENCHLLEHIASRVRLRWVQFAAVLLDDSD
jgi:hypothetical protein